MRKWGFFGCFLGAVAVSLPDTLNGPRLESRGASDEKRRDRKEELLKTQRVLECVQRFGGCRVCRNWHRDQENNDDTDEKGFEVNQTGLADERWNYPLSFAVNIQLRSRVFIYVPVPRKIITSISGVIVFSLTHKFLVVFFLDIQVISRLLALFSGSAGTTHDLAPSYLLYCYLFGHNLLLVGLVSCFFLCLSFFFTLTTKANMWYKHDFCFNLCLKLIFFHVFQHYFVHQRDSSMYRS